MGLRRGRSEDGKGVRGRSRSVGEIGMGMRERRVCVCIYVCVYMCVCA